MRKKAGHGVVALMLAGACLPAWAQSQALADADLLYCGQVYSEAATLLKADPDPGVRRTARDALSRSLPLKASDNDLLKEDAARHARAGTEAQKRLSALPVAPLEARRLALRAAYVECRYLQKVQAAASAKQPPPVPVPVMSDTDLLYCAQLYAEAGVVLKADPDPAVRRTARDALIRSRPLSERDNDLLNDDPARHARAATQAQKRLSAMPVAPLEARRLALRAAYVECRQLQAGKGMVAAPAAVPALKAGSPSSVSFPAHPPTPPSATALDIDLDLDDAETPLPAPAPAAKTSDTAPVAGKGDNKMQRLWRALVGPRATPPAPVLTPEPAAAAPVSGSDIAGVKSLWRDFASTPEASGADTRPASEPDTSTAAAAPAPGAPRKKIWRFWPAPATPPAETTAATMPALSPEPRADNNRSPGLSPSALAAITPDNESAAAAADDDEILAAVLAAATRPATDAAASPAFSGGLGAVDLLYCAQVYAETATLLGQDRNADQRNMAEDALRRSQPLSERDYDLLNEDPQQHAQASAEAEKRLAALPATPAYARRLGLRKAYAECRELQDGKPEIAAPASPETAPATTAPAPSTPRKPDTRPATPAVMAVPAAPASAGLNDANMLYCAHVYAEAATAFSEGDGEAAAAAREALERSRPLSERDYDLLNDDPARHSRASAAAEQRLAALPEKPGRARSVALRAAYEECRDLEDRATAATAPAPGGNRVQMLANRRFCRELLMRTLKVSQKVRAGFTPSERAALDEIQKIGEALAQPMPGTALTLKQDREANQLTAQLRKTLDQAVANWNSGKDPVVQAMGQCHEDYVQGLLGGPDVLSRAEEETAAPAAAAATPAVRPADLGPVFHMREVTPAGNFDGIWFRRGRSALYDAFWVNVTTGQLQRDVLELRGIVEGELTVYRQSYRGDYRARVRPNGTLSPGTASWLNSAAYSWSPLPPQYVRAATGDLGGVVHMREVTPYGNYEGIWRQRGQTSVYDVVWVFLPTGEITADVLAVMGVANGQLIIQRENGPGIYPIKRRTGSIRAANAVKGGKVTSQWVVLPAQSVRLGGAPR